MEKLPRHTRIVKVAWIVCGSAGVWVRRGVGSTVGGVSQNVRRLFQLCALCVCGKFPCFILRICDNFNFYLHKHCRESFWWARLEFPFKPSHPLSPLPHSSPPLSMPRWRIKFPNYIYDFLLLLLFRYDLPVMLLRQCLRVVAFPLCHSPWYECLRWLYMFSFLCHFYCIIYRVRREFSIHFHDVEVLPFSQAIKLIKYI